MDIHEHNKRLESSLNKINKDKAIRNDNKKMLLDFKDDLVVKSIGIPRILKYLSNLTLILRELKKPASKLTTNDAKSIVIDIETNENYTDWTKHDKKVVFRIFGLWLNKNYKINLKSFMI